MNELLVGVDIGSTTTKIAAVTPDADAQIVYSDYQRHNAKQIASVKDALKKFVSKFPTTKIRLCLTGSGSKLLAEGIHFPFVQEVVANSIALCKLYKRVGTAIELGGQDAKIVFFKEEKESGQMSVSDMRMNGSCAGGTGAFIDEIASVLRVPVEKFDQLAAQGTCVYDISGRCGVYAKTDIQPLLNQGVSKADLALSSFHAIAKQTIGGLAQGLDIEKPVVFEGGPLTFHKTLVRVFKERLHLSEIDVIIPERPEIMIAYGAALSLQNMHKEAGEFHTAEEILTKIDDFQNQGSAQDSDGEKYHYFASEAEKKAFDERHRLADPVWKKRNRGKSLMLILVSTPAVPLPNLC